MGNAAHLGITDKDVLSLSRCDKHQPEDNKKKGTPTEHFHRILLSHKYFLPLSSQRELPSKPPYIIRLITKKYFNNRKNQRVSRGPEHCAVKQSLDFGNDLAPKQTARRERPINGARAISRKMTFPAWKDRYYFTAYLRFVAASLAQGLQGLPVF